MLKTFILSVIINELGARYSQYYHYVWQANTFPWYANYDPKKVMPLREENYSRQIDAQHLLNMSIELIRDIHIKNRHATLIQKTYDKDPQYKLGLIIAGAIDKFAHMVKIFKYYARPEIYNINALSWYHRHATLSMHQGYQIMQGDYNEMRLEHEMFFDNIANLEKGFKGKAQQNVDDFKSTMTVEEWNELTEEQQNEKIEEFKSIYATSGGRRSMDGLRKRTKLDFTRDAAQEEYKRSLRYKKWAEKWQGFDPHIEGIEISRPLARMGRNSSKFLGFNGF